MFRPNRVAKRGFPVAMVASLATVLLWAIATSAQVEIGQNLKMNLSGSLGYGYSGSFGSQGSNHGNGFTGSADLTGYYFHQNFLSYQIRPYYDRNQSNSESQTITRGTGLSASIGLFGGSRFPGSVSFGKDFSSNSEFRVAGVPSIVGDSSGQSIGFSWSALVPNWPQLRANYTISGSDSSVAGSSIANENNSKSLSLTAEYQLAGFGLQGTFNNTKNHFLSGEFMSAEEIIGGGSSTSYGLTAQHTLPLSGNVGLGWSRSVNSTEGGSNGASNSYTAGVSMSPFRRVAFSGNAGYTTNLSAALRNSLSSSYILPEDSKSNSFYVGANSTWSVGRGLAINGHINRRQQLFGGIRYSDVQYGGTVNYNYATPLFGFLYMGIGLVDSASKTGNDSAGLVANVNLNRKLGHWETNGDFNYSQNAQTLVAFVTTSSYTYGGSVRRKINNDTSFRIAFRGSHSGLTAQEGNGNRSETYAASFAYKRYSLSSNYSQSTGSAILTSTGSLSSDPLGSLITDDIILYNASSLGLNGSARLFRRVGVVGGYAKFRSTTARGLSGTLSSGERYNARMEYRLRKFSVIGGFNRTMQDVSIIPGGPRVVNSYFLSLSRWFNVF